MHEDTTVVDTIRTDIHLSLDELARRGAQRMLEAALQAEVDEYEIMSNVVDRQMRDGVHR